MYALLPSIKYSSAVWAMDACAKAAAASRIFRAFFMSFENLPDGFREAFCEFPHAGGSGFAPAEF